MLNLLNRSARKLFYFTKNFLLYLLTVRTKAYFVDRFRTGLHSSVRAGVRTGTFAWLAQLQCHNHWSVFRASKKMYLVFLKACP